MRAFDEVYPGGVLSYVNKCRDLLGKSSRGQNPYDGWTPSVCPFSLSSSVIGPSYNRYPVQYGDISST